MSYPEIQIRFLYYDLLLWILLKRRKYFSLRRFFFFLKIQTLRIRLRELHHALIKNQTQHPRFLKRKKRLCRHIHWTLLYMNALLREEKSE